MAKHTFKNLAVFTPSDFKSIFEHFFIFINETVDRYLTMKKDPLSDLILIKEILSLIRRIINNSMKAWNLYSTMFH